MKLWEKIRFYIIAEIMLFAVSMGFIFWGNKKLTIYVIECAIQILLILYGIFQILIPYRRFDKTMFMFRDTDSPDEVLQVLEKEHIPYMEELKIILNDYADQKTKHNMAQILNKQTELTALQSQINPHFLYNTLDTIRGQALLDDNYEIAKMVEALSSFFRYSISRKGNLVTLRDELANINNYMLIQRYRFNNRFSLEIIIDEEDKVAYDFLIPRLIIQPVVENAIFHGLEEKLEGGTVTIEIIVTERNLILMISDNGKGMDRKTLNALNDRICSNQKQPVENVEGNQRSTGIALPNIHRRIQLLFGEAYGVHVYSSIGQGTDVEITIPADYKMREEKKNEKRDSENYGS